jgi:hypothetical protein
MLPLPERAERGLGRLTALAVSFSIPAIAFAADGGPGGTGRLMELTALLAPLGISPFLALAAIGFASSGGYLSLPEGVAALSLPTVFWTLLAVGLVLELGKSSKLTRPLAEGVGTSESLVAIVAAFLLFAAEMTAPAETAVQASMVGAVFWGLVAVATVSVVLALRVLFDVLIWLSPIPFIDFAFELSKTLLTFALVALAAWAPGVALVVFAALFIAAVILSRRAIRAGRMALTVLWDNTLGHLGPAEAAQLPVVAFCDRIPGVARHAQGYVSFEEGTWRFAPLAGGPSARGGVVLGADEGCRIHRRWAGFIIEFPRGRVLLPPRYGRSEAWLRGQFR